MVCIYVSLQMKSINLAKETTLVVFKVKTSMFCSHSDGVTRVFTSVEERFAPADVLKVGHCSYSLYDI